MFLLFKTLVRTIQKLVKEDAGYDRAMVSNSESLSECIPCITIMMEIERSYVMGYRGLEE